MLCIVTFFFSQQFLHCLLVLAVLIVHCVFKPYKKEYINVIEAAILLCLLGATLAILDENDIYIGKQTSIVFIILPFVYGLFYTLYLIAFKLYRYTYVIEFKCIPLKYSIMLMFCVVGAHVFFKTL